MVDRSFMRIEKSRCAGYLAFACSSKNRNTSGSATWTMARCSMAGYSRKMTVATPARPEIVGEDFRALQERSRPSRRRRRRGGP